MRKIMIVVAFVLGLSQLAYAQPRDSYRTMRQHYRHMPARNVMRHDNYRHPRINHINRTSRVSHIHHAPPPNYHHYRTAPHYRTIHGDLRRGYRLPPYYRHNQYVITDWRMHNLYAPPRGYHWVQAGGNYVLVAIATGVITSILLGY